MKKNYFMLKAVNSGSIYLESDYDTVLIHLNDWIVSESNRLEKIGGTVINASHSITHYNNLKGSDTITEYRGSAIILYRTKRY